MPDFMLKISNKKKSYVVKFCVRLKYCSVDVFMNTFPDVSDFDVFKKAQFSVVNIMNEDFWRDEFLQIIIETIFHNFF